MFRSGARVSVGEASRVRLGAGAATMLAGRVESLSAVPTVPLVAPIAGAGSAIAAVRIRAGSLTAIAPAAGETTLAASTALEVSAIATDGYAFEIEAPDAALVFERRTTEPRVVVPPEALRPGLTFRWRARARSAQGFDLSADGWFRTLAVTRAEERERLRREFVDPDAETRAFLAEIDLGLGLWHEALDGFRAARAAGAYDAVVGDRIADIERRLFGAAVAGRREQP